MTTAGEGGMVTTNDSEAWARGWAFKDHGKSYDTVYNTQHPPGFRWLIESWGSNWRLSEVQSAIGRRQLAKLPRWLKIRHELALIFDHYLLPLRALRVPKPEGSSVHAYYKYYCYVRPDLLRDGESRDTILDKMRDAGLPAYSGSCSEIYKERCFEGIHTAGDLPIGKELGETSIMLLVHPTQTRGEVEHAAKTISEIISAVSVDE